MHVVSKEPTFHYYPSLYHTATGGSRIVSSIPLGELFGGKPIQLTIDEAVKIDHKKKTVTLLSKAKLEYDVVIIALGMITNFFGIHGLEEHSLTVKSIDRVEKLKTYLQKQLTDERKPDLNYVLIGGGATGVEYAGALPQYLRELMKKHRVRNRRINIELVEAKPQILPQLPPAVSKRIAKRLRKLGVKVMTNKTVDKATADRLVVSGKAIMSRTIIWTAGVTNNPFFKNNGFTLNERGKVVVDQFMRAFPDVYVLGDNADTKYSGLAQTALHDAITVADNLIRLREKRAPRPYKPKRPVYVIPVGRNWAAVVWGRLHFYGRLGWVLRLAADWIGYRDLEPWWKATVRTMADVVQED